MPSSARHSPAHIASHLPASAFGRGGRLCLACLAVLCALPAIALKVDIPAQPASPHADTEVSTNIAVNAVRSDARSLAIHIRVVGSPSNALEVAFGRDANTNGILDAAEVETVYGWRAGRCYVENVAGWERFESATADGRCGSLDFHVENGPSASPARVLALCDGQAAFPELSAGPPPAWLYRKEWNLLRVTRRGLDAPSEWIRCRINYPYLFFHAR